MNIIDDESLVLKAVQAMQNSYCPYSKFSVGCALQGASGTIYLGCNIENASYGITMCAERVALFGAVASGETKFDKIVVASSGVDFPYPCGACRQALSEFCNGNLSITLVNGKGQTMSTTFAEIFPHPFELKKA